MRSKEKTLVSRVGFRVIQFSADSCCVATWQATRRAELYLSCYIFSLAFTICIHHGPHGPHGSHGPHGPYGPFVLVGLASCIPLLFSANLGGFIPNPLLPLFAGSFLQSNPSIINFSQNSSI